MNLSIAPGVPAVDRRTNVDVPAQRVVRILATLAAALVLVIVVASAYMRLSAAGLSCSDWPACYGHIATTAEPTTHLRIARVAHRIAATAVAAIVLTLVGVTLVARPRRIGQALAAIGALGVVVGLAVLGIATSRLAAAPLLPAVTLANLLGGFVLLALVVAVRATSDPIRVVVASWVRTLALVAVVVVALQAVLGGFVSARFAGLACPTFPLCGVEVPTRALPALLDPFAPIAVDAANTIVRAPALAALQWAHRVGAHAVLFLAIALAIGLARARHFALATAAIAPVIAELALGAGSVVFDLPLPVVLAHTLVAALLLATLVAVALRCRSS
jgi:cytochrome c oxidase assembly protein subunit 15